MSAPMRGPSTDRVTELAPMWESVSVHEAGHAVVGVLLDVPVHHVRLDYQRMGFRRWEVAGYTGIGPNGLSAVLDEHVAVLFAVAGLHAEALWISAAHNMPLPQAQASVESRKASRGDLDTITECLPDAGLTLETARNWCHNVLISHWHVIEGVATALREHHYLTGADVARLV